MKTKVTQLICLFTIAVFVISCNDDVERTVFHYTPEEYALISERLDLPSEVHEYGQEFESFINTSGNNMNSDIFGTGNEVRNHIATLGRVLFYDTKLSINNTVSCGSCHQQNLAFADDVALSVGFDGEVSFRNSLPLGNTVGFETAYGGGGSFVSGGSALFGWDESNENIQSQSLAAITSTVEMGMHDMKQVKDKLSNDPVYEILFEKAFGTKKVQEDLILEALDKFVNSIVSNKSRFDKAAMSNSSSQFVNVFSPFSEFTAAENKGKTLFNSDCASCHSLEHTFTAVARANNGLDLVYQDKGVASHTNLESDNGVFKVPFLRNIELTGPYMHDGRFETLEEVVDFYSDGIKNHDNLDFRLKDFNNSPKNFNYTDKQKNDLIAYLKTLTDENLTSDTKWSDPFN